MWRSEHSFVESLLSYRVDAGNQTQVVGLGGKPFYPSEPSYQPSKLLVLLFCFFVFNPCRAGCLVSFLHLVQRVSTFHLGDFYSGQIHFPAVLQRGLRRTCCVCREGPDAGGGGLITSAPRTCRPGDKDGLPPSCRHTKVHGSDLCKERAHIHQEHS